MDQLSARVRRVLARLACRRHVVRALRTESGAQMSLCQKAVDRIARWCSSWVFVGAFRAFVLLWSGWNLFSGHPLDPYPFHFLNLLLSMLAAVQAPVIVARQSRQGRGRPAPGRQQL